MVFKFRFRKSFYQDKQSSQSGISSTVGLTKEILPKRRERGILITQLKLFRMFHLFSRYLLSTYFVIASVY